MNRLYAVTAADSSVVPLEAHLTKTCLSIGRLSGLCASLTICLPADALHSESDSRSTIIGGVPPLPRTWRPSICKECTQGTRLSLDAWQCLLTSSATSWTISSQNTLSPDMFPDSA